MKKNKKWVKVAVKVSPQVHDRMLELLDTGLWGTSLPEIAERLICIAVLMEFPGMPTGRETPKKE